MNVAGVTRLPGRVDLGLNFSYSSAPPFSAFIGGVDLNGDGTPAPRAGSAGDLLPGTTVNAFNRGMGRADLERLVDEFNRSVRGHRRRGADAASPLCVRRQFSLAGCAAEPIVRDWSAAAGVAHWRGVQRLQRLEPVRVQRRSHGPPASVSRPAGSRRYSARADRGRFRSRRGSAIKTADGHRPSRRQVDLLPQLREHAGSCASRRTRATEGSRRDRVRFP